jgi:hypothetical protein
MRILTAAIFILLLSAPSYATQQTNNNPLVDQIIRDVVDYAVDEGKRVLEDNTGVDLQRRGYEVWDYVPDHVSGGMERELRQLGEEHDREILKLYDELDQKLAKEKDEFARESAKEDNSEKIAEKPDKLQKKVDEANWTFDEKVHEENKRFDKKRREILGKNK